MRTSLVGPGILECMTILMIVILAGALVFQLNRVARMCDGPTSRTKVESIQRIDQPRAHAG
jgi:hypothetical protein